MKTINLEEFRKGAREVLVKEYGLEDKEKNQGAYMFAAGVCSAIALLFFIINFPWAGVFFIFCAAIMLYFEVKGFRALKPVNKPMKEIGRIENALELRDFLCVNLRFKNLDFFHRWIVWFSIHKPYAKKEKGQIQPEFLSFFPAESLEFLGKLAYFLDKREFKFGIDPRYFSERSCNSEFHGKVRIVVYLEDPVEYEACKQFKGLENYLVDLQVEFRE